MSSSDSVWQPSATRDVLQHRARISAEIRAFFVARGVLEVETPYLSAAGVTDPHIEGFRTRYEGPGLEPGTPLYLHTSPEFPMKRLLAAGSGDIFQICRVFRDGEASRLHNPEFTLLEWYRVGMGYQELMAEVAELTAHIIGDETRQDIEWHSYCGLFQQRLGVDPLTATKSQLRQVAAHHRLPAPDPSQMSIDDWLDLLLGCLLQPQLGVGGIAFLYDYPASQASLARLSPDNPQLAQRFELFVDGVELGNGFGELTDAAEQQRRFEFEQGQRQQMGVHLPPLDHNLISALHSGLPECSGVAIGLDRLIMVALGAKHLDQVLSFPLARA